MFVALATGIISLSAIVISFAPENLKLLSDIWVEIPVGRWTEYLSSSNVANETFVSPDKLLVSKTNKFPPAWLLIVSPVICLLINKVPVHFRMVLLKKYYYQVMVQTDQSHLCEFQVYLKML